MVDKKGKEQNQSNVQHNTKNNWQAVTVDKVRAEMVRCKIHARRPSNYQWEILPTQKFCLQSRISSRQNLLS